MLVGLALVAGLALCIHGGVNTDGLLSLTPVLAIAIALFGRRYPGERLLSAIARRRRRHARSPRASRAPARSRAAARVPRGGLLMGFALAVRPPPAAPLAS